jgi:hypothetical protein
MGPRGGRRGARPAPGGGLPWLWHLNGRGHEGLAFLERAIRRAPEERTRLQARLLTGVALVADTADPLDLEFDAAQRALELATELGDERLRGLGLALAAVGQFYTDFDAGWEIAAEAMRAAEAGGGGLAIDASPALQAIILHLRDEHAAAQPLREEAAARLLRRGDRGVAATVVGCRASGALATGTSPTCTPSSGSPTAPSSRRSRAATSRTGPEHRMLAPMPVPDRHAPRIPAATAAPARSIIAITP